jgi:hypothetical protein
MFKPRTILLSLLLSIAGVATAAAGYNSASIGPNTGSSFSERTVYLHDGAPSPMMGLSGRADGGGYAAWIAGRADGGNWTDKHGYQKDYDGDYNVFCSGTDAVSGLEGWSTTDWGVNGLRIRCRSVYGGPQYGMMALLGSRTGTYKAIQCNSADIAWGFYGKEGPYLMQVGLYCNSHL